MRKSPLTRLDSFEESSCEKAERPNSVKATGTGLRAGPGALVTSAIKQVPREGGHGVVSDSRSQVLGKVFSQRLRSLRLKDQSSPAYTVCVTQCQGSGAGGQLLVKKSVV